MIDYQQCEPLTESSWLGVRWKKKIFNNQRSTFGWFVQVFNASHDSYLQPGVNISSSGLSPFFEAERKTFSHFSFRSQFGSNPVLRTFWTHPSYGGPLWEYKNGSRFGYRISRSIGNQMHCLFSTKVSLDSPNSSVKAVVVPSNDSNADWSVV